MLGVDGGAPVANRDHTYDTIQHYCRIMLVISSLAQTFAQSINFQALVSGWVIG